MKSTQMAKKLFEKKMCEIYELIPDHIVPIFLTRNNQVRSVILNEYLGIYKYDIVKRLQKDGYNVICGEDALLVEFDP
jgi:hypothetical protein